jgi:DNA polymerase III epsilon subunit-like protein
MIKRYTEFIKESIKYFSTPELFEWLEERRDHVFIALDTETTGLRGPWKEQLTQIAAVAFKFDFDNLRFVEIDSYNQKIKLTPETLAQKDQEGSRIKDVFKYTRYGVGGGKFREEQEVINSLLEFVGGFEPSVLLVQNAPFDLPMINVRAKFGRLNTEIFDTKDFFAYFMLPTLQKLAEQDPEAQRILSVIGTTSSGKLPTSSLPKVAAGLGVDPNEAHDALFDCRYMVSVLEKGLDIVNNNLEIDRKEFIRPRISTDRYIRMKNRESLRKNR